VTSCKSSVVFGPYRKTNPQNGEDHIGDHPNHISTSFVERQNLTMRMAIRRFTRLTLKAACALHFAYYNFCRVHSSLRATPAMEAGITDHVWTIAELLT
jgi:hypothetical protein